MVGCWRCRRSRPSTSRSRSTRRGSTGAAGAACGKGARMFRHRPGDNANPRRSVATGSGPHSWRRSIRLYLAVWRSCSWAACAVPIPELNNLKTRCPSRDAAVLEHILRSARGARLRHRLPDSANTDRTSSIRAIRSGTRCVHRTRDRRTACRRSAAMVTGCSSSRPTRPFPPNTCCSSTTWASPSPRSSRRSRIICAASRRRMAAGRSSTTVPSTSAPASRPTSR